MNFAADSLLRKEWFWVTLLRAAAAWLFLANLDDQRLWQDEAQTALIARTVLADGVPRAKCNLHALHPGVGSRP
jgi:hypothetical protein